MDPVASVPLPCLVGLNVLVQHFFNVIGLDHELTKLLGGGAEVLA
jgi:hypothetical protein